MSELKQKIFQVLDQPRLAALATLAEEGRPWVRYVVAVADEDLTVRVATYMGSRKVAHISKNPEVHLIAGADGMGSTENYVQVQARAEVSTDPEVKKAFWQEEFETYFQGPDDPEYCVLMIRPYRIELWSMETMEPEVWEG